MFQILILEDKLKLLPDQFSRDILHVLEEQIEAKYCNKIVPDVGFCIGLYDYVHIGDQFVYPGEGAAHLLVQFRLIIFIPFEGEILMGNVIAVDPNGIKVSLDFFTDIYIPSYNLSEQTVYADNKWIWSFQGSEFVIEKNDQLRFQVKYVHFRPHSSTIVTSAQSNINSDCNQIVNSMKFKNNSIDDILINGAAMTIIGSITSDGLGLVSWYE